MSANSTSSSTTFGKFLFGMFSILMLLSGSLKVNAQASTLYNATTGANASLVLDKNGNAIDMSAGTTQLHGANISASGSATTNIGFSFYLLGGSTSFSQFTANVNGAIRLGSTGVGGSVVTASASASFLLACNVAGKTDNTSGKVHSKLFGTSPNRVLVVEWKDVWVSNFGASNNNLSTYQTRIYEDGTVEYVYGAMFNNNTSTVNANIGISSSNTGGTILQVITPTTSPAFKTDSTAYRNNVIPLNSAINNLNSSADGSRRFFRFAPASCQPAPTAQPTLLVATATTNSFSSIGGSFTAASPAPGGYLVVRTTQNTEPTLTSGVNYMLDSSYSTNVDFRVVANGAATTFTATGLGSGRTYYFWVYSYNAPTTAAPCGAQVYNTTSPLTGQATTNVAVSPTCVTSTTPSNNFNGFSPVDTLRWTAVTSLPTVTTYFFYISKTQALVDANSPTVRTAAGNILKLQPGTLEYSTTYFWKVRAFNGVDTANCDTRSFTTAAPSVPLCYQGAVTPTSGATGVSTTANIVWGNAVGAPSPTGYDIYISTNSAAVQGLQLSARIISGTTSTSFTPGITTIVLNPGTQYFWTVVPTNYIGGASGCTVYSFTTYAPGKITSTTRGGLWSDANTWVGGIIPAANDSVIINDGAVVYVSSAPSLVRNLIIGQGGANAAVLQLGASLTVSGNITINSNGRLLPFNTSAAGQIINVGGNFTNNGYTNLALASTQLNFNGSQVGGGSAAQVLGGTGTFEGDTTGTGNGSVIGVIRDLRFQTTGSSTISTTQSLAVNGNFYHTGGSLNTNGKLMIDNSKQLFGNAINHQVAALAVTAHGTSAYSVATPPVVGPSGAILWQASTAFAANQVRVTATNMYVVANGSGNSGTTAPSTTTTSAITDGGWNLYWVGATGTIGLPYNPNTTRTLGAQYFYGNKLFTLYKINTSSPSTADYGTLYARLAAATNIGDRVGSTLGDSLVLVGAPATATVNLLETPAASGSGSVRSLNLTSAGSGYYTATPSLGVVNMTTAVVTAPTVAATFIQSSAGATNSTVFKVPNATITGGLTILSDLQVRGVSASAGGINYGGTPRVGFPLPTNFHNLVTRSGSGFTVNPTTIRVYGGTTLPNFSNPTFNFNVAQGRLVSAICTAGGTGWLTQPDSIRVAATTGTDSATIRFPANSLARAVALMRARSVVGFRVTNAGDGYASAPTPTLDSTGNTGQAFTAATAAGITSRVGLYNLTYQVLNPTILVSEGTTSVEIPANKQINVLTINNKAKVKYAASSDTLKIIGGSGALVLSAAASNPTGVNQYGTTLDMNGGLLFFYSPLYTGFGSVTNYGQQDAYGHVKNGSMRIALPGTTATTTGATRIFPFRSPVSLFTGTRTANGSDGPSMGYVTVSESGAPSTTDPASKVPVGRKSYNVKAEPFISNASLLYGVNPIFTMVYGASDSLPGSLTFANLSIGQSSSATGTWVDRGRALGLVTSGQTNVANTDPITPQLSVATTTTVTGPFVTNAGNDFFALLNIASNPTVTTITPSAFCSAGGEAVTLTGTGFIGTTQVLFNGLAATSFSVVSNTSITAVTPNGITAGNVTVISNGLTGISSSTYSVRNIGTFTPTVNPPNGLICTATDRVTISLNDIGADSYSWSPSTGLDVAQGLSVVATPTVSTTYTVSAAFSASGSNAACTVTAKFVVGPIPGTPIVPTASPAASCFNAGQTVTLNSNLSAGNFTVSNITYAPSTVPSTATNLADRGNVPAGVNYQCAYCPLDDAGFPNIPIGFNFNFFGSFFDKLSAGTNGLLLFGQVPSYAANAGINQYTFNNTPVTFPNAENPGNVIAAGIADLGAQTATQPLTCTLTFGSTTVTTANGYIFNIGDSLVGTGIPAGTLVTGVVSSTSATSGVGTTTFTMSNAATSSGSFSVSFQIKPFIRYWTEGSAPTRKFVFEYKSVGGSGGTNTPNSGTVQVMLYETTGIVEMHIQKINNTTARTYGLQDVTKQIGAVAPGRQAYGNGTFVAEAWRFAPPTNYGFLWSPSTGLDATNTSSVIYSVTSPGAKSVNLKVTNPVTGCVTNKVVPFLVNVTPNAPTVSGVLSVCGSGFTALTSNYPAAGNSIKWYDAPIGGTLLNTGTLFVTPVIFQSTTYYVEEVTNRVLNPCSSPRTAVTVTITPPPAFAVNKPVLCGNITSTQLNVTTDQSLYDTYTWAPVSGLFEDAGLTIPYSGRSIGTVYAGSLIPGDKKYICSASNFETLCATKDSSEIVVQPNTATISANPAVICVSGTSDLTLNTSTAPYAGTIQWQLSLNGTTFDNIVGATTTTITAPNSLQTRYYRAIIKGLDGNPCYTSPTYTLNTINPQVSSASAVGFCSTSGIPVMTATAPAGGGIINWYSGANQTGGTSLGTGTTYSPTNPITQTTSYYVGLTVNGCEGGRTLVTANVATPTPITVSNNRTVCNNGVAALSVTSAEANYNSYVWTPTANLYSNAAGTIPYVPGTSAITVYARTTAAGTTTYTVNASNASTQCTTSGSIEVTVLAASYSVSGTRTAICGSGANTSVLTISPSTGMGSGSFAWESGSDGITYNAIGAATSSTYTTPAITATTYYNGLVKDQSGTTCFTAPITITYSNPSVSADSVNGGLRCGSGPVALSVTNTLGTIKWYRNASGGSSLATGNNYTPTVLSSTNYFVSITVNGCEGSTRTAVPVTIETSPTLTLASTSQTVSCNNPIVEISVSSTLSDYDTYVWTPATNLYTDAAATNAYIAGSSATTVYVKSDTAGVYIYTVSANNSLSCSNIKYDTVTVTATNPVDATPASATVCNNGITQLNATAVSSYDTYVWSPITNLFTDAAATQAYTAGQSAATVYFKSGTVGTATYVAYGSNNGSPCVGTDTVRLTVMPASGTITSGGAASFCRTGGATLTFTPASTLPSGASVQWQLSLNGTTYNDIPSATSLTLAISGVTTTTYYRVNAKNSAGDICFSANYTQTVVNPTITGSTGGSRCGNGGVVLTATASAGASLAWYTSTSSSNVLSTSSSFTTPSVSVTTTYYVAAVIGSCESTPRTAVVATVASAPTATVSAAQTVCNNTAAMIAVTSTLSDYDSYVWTTTPASDISKLYTDAAGTIPYVGSTSASTVYLKTTTVGSTTVKLNATNSQTACTFTTASTTVAVQPASATAAITSGATLCKTGTATLTVTPATGYAAGLTQVWQTSLNGTDYTNLPSASATTYTTATLTASTYYRFMVLNSLGGTCFTTNANQVVVANPPITGTTPASRCGFGSVTLNATAAAGTISWYASQDAASNEGIGSSFATPTLSSTYTYWVGVKVGTCEGTRVSVVATVNPAPEVHVRVVGGVDSFKTVCNNVVTQINVMPEYISNFDNYVWTPNVNLFTDAAGTIPYVDGASTTTIYVKRSAIGATRYFCTATNTLNGCANQDTAFISVQPGTASISGNPASICTSVSSSSSLSLVPGSGYATNTIQWQVSADGVAAYTNISGATNSTYSATNTSTRFYQTVIRDGAGATCFTTNPFQLVYNNPSVDLPYTKRSRCGRGSVELKAFASPGATIKWYTTEFGGSPLTPATDSTFITPAISAQTIYYVSATLNGCESLRVPDTATVSDPPVLTITAPQTVCNNVIATFTVESDPADYEAYTWTPATNLYTDPQATVPYVANSSAATVYARTASPGTVNYEISSSSLALGCSNLTTTSLSVQLLSATISGSPSALCINGTSTLSLNPSTPYGVGSIQWERSTDGTTFVPTPGAVGTTYVTPNQTATRFYRASVKNGAGANCFVTPVFNLVVNNPAVLTTTGASICGPKTATVSATTTAGSQLKWYSSGRLDDVTVLATGPSYTTPVLTSTTTFFVQSSTITNASCASSRIPVTVTFNQPPVLSISSSSASYCAGGSSSLVTITNGYANYDSYVWTPSTGITGNAINGWVFNPQSTTNYSLVASQSTGNACTFNIPFAVTVNPLPVIDSVRANGGTSATVCAGTQVTLNGYAGGIGSGPQTLPTGYASSSATNTADDEIFNVTILGTTLNNTSTCATIAPGPGSAAALYANYTTSVAAPTLIAGSPYSGSITIGQCSTTPYSTGYAVFIDYNRNGVFEAGETAFTAANSTSNAVAGTVRPFNFTIPSSATPGVTLMRVVAVESSAGPSATGTYTWGETEDYAVNILAITVINPDIVFTWSPGGATGASVVVNPSTTTTYTVAASNAITGCVAAETRSVTVNVNQLPTAPESSNSVQCGIAVPTCFVGGASNGDYRWYLAQTGGTALPGQVNNQLSAYPISTTTTFYVSIFNGTCESLRTPVTASVIQPDQLTAASSLTASCANGQITLSVTQNGTSNTYDYVWTASPVSGSGISTSVSGSSVDVTPTVAGTYVYTVTGTDATAGCVAANTVTVTVRPTPAIGTATATPSTFCAGGSTSLTINPALSTGPQVLPTGYLPSNATNTADEEILRVVFGTLDNSSTCSTTGGTGSTLNLYSNYTTTVAAPTVIAGDSVTVGFTVGYCGTTAFQNIATMYFDWNRDGDFADAGEAAIGKAYGAAALGGTFYSGKIRIPVNASPGRTMMRVVLVEASTIAPTGTYTYGETEDYAINIIGSSFQGSNFTYTWSPGSLTGQTVSATPQVNTTYEATVTNPTTGCFSKATVNVTVNQLPPAPTGSTSEQCGVGVPAATVTSNSAAATPRFRWYLTQTGGTALQDSTSTTYTSTVDSTKVFWVAEVSAQGCEGPRASVTVNVAQPDQIQLTHSAASICLGQSVDISSSYSPINNLYDSYSIAGFPATGSGLSSSTSLTDLGFATAPITITPTAAGTYVYLITAVDNSFGCSTVGKDTIIVNALPVIDSLRASVSAICAGGSVNLNAYSSLTATLPAPTTLPTGYCAGGGGTNNADEQIFAVSFASMTNVQTENCSSNYTNYTNSIAAPSVTRGSAYPFSVTVNECDGPNFSSGIALFIDYNRDGDFADAGETVGATTATTASPYTKTATVTIPAGASPGRTVMRVVCMESVATPTACGTFTYGEVEDYSIYIEGDVAQTVPVNPNLTYTWNPGSVTGSSATVTPAATTDYAVTINNPATGCTSVSSPVSITVNPLPSAPIGTNSIQCGAGVPTVSVASGDATASPILTWYNSATPPTEITQYSNLFNSTNVASLNGATLFGSASLTGTRLTLTPNLTTQVGAITIPASGVNGKNYSVAFRMTTGGGGGADGLSYSFGDDADATSTTLNAEYGSGSKLKIGFDNFGTGATAAAGIRLIYGASINDPGQLVGTNGVLAYSSDLSWIGLTDVPVVATINNAGKLTMSVNGNAIFSNVQLPSGFTSANKSTWKHVFEARTGGSSMIHQIDSVVLNYTASDIVNTGTTYSQPISQTTTFYVAETSAFGCEGPRTAVVATVNIPDSIRATASSNSICIGSPVTLTATTTTGSNNNNYTFTWGSTTGSGITGTTSGGTGSFGNPATTTVTPTAAGTYVFNLNGTDVSGAQTCNVSSSVTVVVNSLPVLDSARASSTSVCAGAPVTLQAYSGFMDAGPATQPTGYCTVANLGVSALSYFDMFSTTGATQNINNSASGYSTNGYGNFGSQMAIASAGQTINFNTTLLGTTVGVAIWVDWNRNGTFETTERVYVTSGYVSTATGSFVVPANATPGATRMRVMMDYITSVPADPCAISSTGRGEVEDYTFRVINGNNIDNSLTYTWNPGNVTNNTGALTVNPTTTTTYTVSATNAAGCAATTNRSVTVTVVPVTATASASLNTVCNGTAVTLTATPTGSGPFTYSWSNGTSVVGTTATLSVTPSTTTTYTVTVRDVCNNPATSATTVTVNPLPTASISQSSPIVICAPNTQELTAVTSAASPVFTWSLNGNVIGGATTSSYTATASGSYTVAITDAATGCNSAVSSAVVITVNAQPTPIVITPSAPSICIGSSTTLSLTGGDIINPGTLALTENFNTNAPNWTITNGQSSPVVSNWTLRTAPLTYASPNGEGSFNNFSTPNGGKFILAVADAGGNGSVTNTIITSPVFNTTNFTLANLVFEHAYKFSAANEAKVEVSTNGGTSWTTLKTYTGSQGSTGNNNQVTRNDTISMAAYLNQTNLRIRYNYQSNYGFWWLIDNIRVTGTQNVPCTYSWTPSATLNTASGATVIASPTVQTTYTVTATSQFGCTRTQTATVSMITRPTGVISGTPTICNGSSGNLSIAVTGTGPWSGTLSNGASFSGSTSPISVSVSPTSNTTYTIASLSDASCASIAGDLSGSATVTVNPRPTATISGTQVICQGSSANLSIAVTGAGPWSGTLSNGASFSGSSSPITVSVTPSASSTTYTVATLSDANCSAIAADMTGSAAVTWKFATSSTTPISACTSYQWNGNTYTSSGSYTFTTLNAVGCDSVAVLSLTIRNRTSSSTPAFICATQAPYSWNGSSYSASGTYTFTTTNAAGCDSFAILVLTVAESIPNPVASVTQPTCATATGTITVTSPVGSGLQYSIGGAYQSSTTFSGVAAGTYTLRVQAGSGCFSAQNTSVTVNPQPIIPGATTVTGQVNVCNVIGTSTAITYTASALGASTYTWSLPANTVLVSGQGTATISVRFLSGFASQPNKQIRVVASSICGSNAFKIYYLAAQLPITPSTIVPSATNVCPSIGTNVSITYTIPKVSGAASYIWNYPSTVSVTHSNGSGENDTVIVVTFASNYTSSSITVQAVNTCGTSGTRSIFVSRNNPSTPGLISGPTNACEYIGASGVNATYSVTAAANVDSYTWTLPAGVSNVNGQGTNTITFRYPAGFTSGTVSVTSTNGCGTSASRSLTINRLTPITPSNIDVINTSSCPNRVYTYSVSALPGNATSLEWNVPNGGTIESGQGTRTITVSYTTGVIDGAVSVRSINNCGVSSYKTSIVKLAPCPAGPTAPMTKGLPIAATNPMDVKVFPNPTTSNFNLQVITADQQEVVVRILDVQGRFIKSVKVAPYQTLSIGSELKSGSYMLEVRQGNNLKTTRVVKY